MKTDKTWVDYWSVQATAWYLQVDIWIVATSSTENSPYIVISGNPGDGSCPSDGPIITLGTKSNCHYQSLLPIETLHLEFQHNQEDPVQELIQARQTFNQIGNKNELAYHEQYELGRKNAKETQIKQQSSSNQELHNAFTLEENS